MRFKIFKNKAFSIIELIFVILLIAIISSISIPKLLNTNNKATLLKCKNDFYNITYALNSYKQNKQLKNENFQLNNLDDGINLFGNILDTPIVASSDAWNKIDNSNYTFNISKNEKINFKYDKSDLTFMCDKTKTLCKELLK